MAGSGSGVGVSPPPVVVGLVRTPSRAVDGAKKLRSRRSVEGGRRTGSPAGARVTVPWMAWGIKPFERASIMRTAIVLPTHRGRAVVPFFSWKVFAAQGAILGGLASHMFTRRWFHFPSFPAHCFWPSPRSFGPFWRHGTGPLSRFRLPTGAFTSLRWPLGVWDPQGFPLLGDLRSNFFPFEQLLLLGAPLLECKIFILLKTD